MDPETITNIAKFVVFLFRQEVALISDVDEKREKLVKDLSRIEDELKCAEDKVIEEKSKETRTLKLKDTFYVLNDILDDCSTEVIRERERCFAFLSNVHPGKIFFRHSIYNRMVAANSTLATINQGNNQPDGNPEVSGSILEWRQTTDEIRTHDIIEGRKEDVRKILGLFLDNSCERQSPFVLPIVGIGGLGKTTLAKLVFKEEPLVPDQERVSKPFFNLKVWIWVGESFDVVKLIKAILASVSGVNAWFESDLGLKDLKQILEIFFSGKRYLLVLDDVWNSDVQKWEQFHDCLTCGLKGSSVLVTTRQRKVAAIMAVNGTAYDLNILPKEHCREVFRKHAFRSVVPETGNFVQMGWDIVDKCKGVPLAVKTTASFLSMRMGEDWWTLAKDSKYWKSDNKENSIFTALRLSYLNLSAELRRCFSYCAVFPKGCEIKKEDLIHLWMANGLICRESNFEVEYVGKEKVDELYLRSLIDEVKRDEEGNIDSFKMHDLVYDLARSIMDDECYVVNEANSTNFPRATRHLSINYEIESSSISELLENVDKSLRTFINFRHDCSSTFLSLSELLRHTCLRALDLSMVANLELLPPMGHLQRMRYMNLSQTDIETLPDSICSLCNLQILKLNGCRKLKALPKFIGRLKSLRHLYATDCSSLESMPESMGQLTSLKTLTLVIVGVDKGSCFQLSQLGRLNHLEGHLAIEGLEKVGDVKNAQKAGLRMKRLHQLDLKWGFSLSNDGNLQLQILQDLEPDKHLKEFKVSGYGGNRFPTWMMADIERFRRIKSVEFSSCKSMSQLPPLWKLRSLKRLCLRNLDSLTSLFGGPEVPALESLESLTLQNLPILEKIKSTDGERRDMKIIFPHLSQLEIYECPRLVNLDYSGYDSLEVVTDQMFRGLSL